MGSSFKDYGCTASRIKILIFILLIVILTKPYTGRGASEDTKVLLLHNNDMHSHFEESSARSGSCKEKGRCYGGFARLKRTVADIRERVSGEREVIFLNAGDTFQGTPYYTFFKWEVAADLIDDLGIDVMSLGNHEFDDGPQGLAPYLNKIKTISVCSNIDVSEEPGLQTPKLKRSTVINLNNTKIGVIGYISPTIIKLRNVGKLKFSDEITAIKREIERLKSESINIIIALGHSGINVDLMLAAELSDIDVVVGGHTNTFMYRGKPPDLEKPQIKEYPKIVEQQSRRKVPVVQAYAFTKYLGYLELDFNPYGDLVYYSGNPILLNHEFPQDENMLKKIEPWKEKVNKIANKVIGITTKDLSSFNQLCKSQECVLGNLIADAYIESNIKNYTGKGWTDASVGLIQGGAIRASINATARGGNITYGDVITVLPFENDLFKIEISGKALREALEYSVHRYEKTKMEQVGEFLQVSGLRIVYDMSYPPFKRIKSVNVRCGKCQLIAYYKLYDHKVYHVILSRYLLNGGDGYKIFRENTTNPTFMSISDTQSVINYFKKNSPVSPEIGGRITILHSSLKNNIPRSEDGSVSVRSGLDLINSLLIFLFHCFIRNIYIIER